MRHSVVIVLPNNKLLHTVIPVYQPVKEYPHVLKDTTSFRELAPATGCDIINSY
jgi:hypothetical protein